MADYLILLSRLGSLPGSSQYGLIEQLCANIPPDSYRTLLMELIDYFNTVYLSKDLTAALSFKQWEDLFFSLQYLDHFDSPSLLLRTIVDCNRSNVSLLEIIHLLLPEPRSGLLGYGMDFEEIPASAVVKELSEHQEECTFYGALILYFHQTSPSFLGEKLAVYLIDAKWEQVGRYFFRKMYHGNRRAINEETRSTIGRQLDTYLLHYFETEGSPAMGTHFSWPEDYLALGGWLAHIDKNEIDLHLQAKIMDDLAEVTANNLVDLSRNLPLLIANEKHVRDVWINEPFDSGSIYINTYIVYALMTCGDSAWKRLRSSFQKVFYEIKSLFYGAYAGNRLAMDLSNRILGLLLTHPKFKDGNIRGMDRLERLFQLFSDIAGYQWVVFAERERIIYDAQDYTPTFGDADLLYVVKRLKDPIPEYVSAVNPLMLKIQNASTTVWPMS